MRTTIQLDEQLLARVREVAAKTGRTMTAVIEDALRQSLTPKKTKGPRERVLLTTVKGKGPRAGVDLDDSAALLDLMDGQK
jgi:metal-responsive CopG/Arc/MetJ family transcriptional regulator